MGYTWRKWSGLFLTLVWVSARLVLPLQAHCPHHASGGAKTTSSVHVPVDMVISHQAHGHGHHSAGSIPSPQQPHESTPAPCECAAQCCAATPVAVDPALVSSIPMPPLLQRAVPFLSQQAIAPRAHTPFLQPPATAPPSDSDLG